MSLINWRRVRDSNSCLQDENLVSSAN